MKTALLIVDMAIRLFVMGLFLIRFANVMFNAGWFSSISSLQKLYASRWEALLLFVLIFYLSGRGFLEKMTALFAL